MGIRFLCQHCQNRLNVKRAQAGQLGLCLHCRKTITVPLESTIPASRARSTVVSSDARFAGGAVVEEEPSDGGSAILDADEQVTMEGLQAGDHQREPVPSHAPQPNPVSVIERSHGAVFELGKPSPPPSFGKVDPIAEAPKKIWYFRTKGFGERGPLKAKAMQLHVDEGNVGIGSMVWREDWNEWVKAEEVFPELAELAREQGRRDRLARAMEDAGFEMTESAPGSGSNRQQLVTLLIIAAVGLVIVGGICFAVIWAF